MQDLQAALQADNATLSQKTGNQRYSTIGSLPSKAFQIKNPPSSDPLSTFADMSDSVKGDVNEVAPAIFGYDHRDTH